MACPTEPILVTATFSEELYDQVARAVVAQMQRLPVTCTSSTCPRADFVGCVVRMAGYDLMDYRTGAPSSGGSDGCIAFSDTENRGLGACLAGDDVSLAKAYEQVPSYVLGRV